VHDGQLDHTTMPEYLAGHAAEMAEAAAEDAAKAKGAAA
jgi:hypothetical protein